MSDWDDWADEATDALEECDYEAGYYFPRSAIASALRAAEKRGRVAGLREAMAVIEDTPLPTSPKAKTLDEVTAYAQAVDDVLGAVESAIRAAADKLEAETP